MTLAGLTVRKADHAFDMFRSRAMFPIIDQQGNVLGFGGRALTDVKPKYLNTADTPVFNKRKGVYAINLIRKIRDLKRILLVEGYMDVVAVSQAGVVGAVATLGTSLTEEQARLLKRYAPEVWIAYDGDEAGQHAIERALGIFEKEGVPVRVLKFPDGLDPDEFIRQRGLDAFNRLPPLTAVSYRMQRLAMQYDLDTQDGRTEYAKGCAALLRTVREPVELENYLELLSVQTGFSRDVLVAQVGITPPAAERYKPTENRENLIAKRQRSSESLRTEQTLLALLATGKLPDGMVKAEDFSDAQPSRILAEAEDDALRQTAGEIFSMLSDSERENPAAVAEDCLKRLHIQSLQHNIQSMTELMRSAPDEETRKKALAEVTTLSKELAQLKQLGR